MFEGNLCSKWSQAFGLVNYHSNHGDLATPSAFYLPCSWTTSGYPVRSNLILIKRFRRCWRFELYSLIHCQRLLVHSLRLLSDWLRGYIYIYMVAPPPPKKKPMFSTKQWYLQCFTHILACRFWKLFLGGSHILIIYKIYMTCKEETLKIQLSSSSCPILPQNRKTEKPKNWIHMENLFLDLSGKFSFSVFLSLSFSANIPTWLRKCSRIVP